jgi:hypothetical protein
MPIKELSAATPEEREAAIQLMEAVNLHVHAQNAELGNGRDRRGYVAVRLSDGKSPDGILYDTRRDAVRHQADPWNFYIQVGSSLMQLREAWVVLMYARQARATGHVFAEEEPILPQRLELVRTLIPRTFRGVNYDRGQ